MLSGKRGAAHSAPGMLRLEGRRPDIQRDHCRACRPGL